MISRPRRSPRTPLPSLRDLNHQSIMLSVQYGILDVFSNTPYKGNPLAVVNDLAGQLNDTQMKLITRQFNLSETTFFLKPTKEGATYKLQSFLPDGREVFGVGHNILGAWKYLALGEFLDYTKGTEVVLSDGSEEFMFYMELGPSVTPVKVLRSRGPNDGTAEYSISIAQTSPKAHGQHPDSASLATSLGLRAQDIGLSSKARTGNTKPLGPRVMSTATTYHLLVPVSSINALEQAVVEKEKLLAQLQNADERAYGIYLFTNDDSNTGSVGDPTYRARFFSPGMSAEDPATGSAAGPLSVFLHQEGYLETVNGKATIQVRQGLQVGRECVIRVDLSVRGVGGEDVAVDIIGSGVRVSEGTMVVPDVATQF